jgi:hypothetical protein
MKLQDEINNFNEQALADIPPATINVMVKATAELAGSGITNRALAKGDTMPPFSLPNATDQLISSADLLAKGPLVISFYRGSW